MAIYMLDIQEIEPTVRLMAGGIPHPEEEGVTSAEIERGRGVTALDLEILSLKLWELFSPAAVAGGNTFANPDGHLVQKYTIDGPEWTYVKDDRTLYSPHEFRGIAFDGGRLDPNIALVRFKDLNSGSFMHSHTLHLSRNPDANLVYSGDSRVGVVFSDDVHRAAYMLADVPVEHPSGLFLPR